MTTPLVSTTRSPFSITGFDAIAQSLVNYLQSQPQFTDYNFAGSNLSVIINLLAYNAYSNALYYNLAINEAFLDSAAKRDSVVSRAAEMGYLPRSKASARAIVNIHVAASTTGTSPPVLILPAMSLFTASMGGTSYNFYNLTPVTTSQNPDGSYDFLGVELVEGVPVTNTYTYTGNLSSQTPIQIANVGADISTLTVKVYPNSASQTPTIYQPISDITQVSASTPVYFIRETRGMLYEIYFGIDGFGATPIPNSLVSLAYLISSGTNANGANNFIFGASFGIGGAVTTTTVSTAAGGADIESIDSIRVNAPSSFMAQNRIVTADDYRLFVAQNAPYATGINVWGGETNIPPQYGKVYVCIAQANNAPLTQYQITTLTNALTTKGMMTVTPVIVNADSLQINVNTTVYYDPSLTTLTQQNILSEVVATINNFSNTITNFNSLFRFSNFQTAIDQSDPAITNSMTSITLTRIYSNQQIYTNSSNTYSFLLGNPISQEISSSGNPAIQSTGFYIVGDSVNVYYIRDDGKGNLQLFYLNSQETPVVVNPYIGTVNYTTGYVNIPTLAITAIVGNQWAFNIIPDSYDVLAFQTQVLSIPIASANINVVPVSRNVSPNTTYPFAPIVS
jgi:hypothetical protein